MTIIHHGETCNEEQREKRVPSGSSEILTTFEKTQAPTPIPDALTFAITTISGVTTRHPPYPTPSNMATVDNTDRIIEEEGPKGEETTTVHVSLPFLEAMIHMPKGAKVLKDLLSLKGKLEKAASSVKLSKECSTVIQRSLPQKEEELENFILPCLIGPLA
ncbi:hypothetical protein Tco_0082791, partial [Tanacetum coccineum]